MKPFFNVRREILFNLLIYPTLFSFKGKETLINMKALVQKDLNGNLVDTFKSSTKAALKLGFNKDNIIKAASGRLYREGNHSYKNFLWSWTDVDRKFFYPPKPKKAKPERPKIIDLPGEIWKGIDGFSSYWISNKGRVKSTRRGGFEKILKPGYTKTGYTQVEIVSDLGITKKLYIHRLVAESFVPNPLGKPFVDHLNTMRDQNFAENLLWCTSKENGNNPLTKIHQSISQKIRRKNEKV